MYTNIKSHLRRIPATLFVLILALLVLHLCIRTVPTIFVPSQLIVRHLQTISPIVQLSTNASFQFDGSTSDLAQQYYRRYASGSIIEPLSFTSQSLPERIRTRLNSIGLDFENLNGYLQRAVIWDSGYALGSGALRKIYTRNGSSMENIAIPAKHYRSVNCTTISCTVHNVPTSLVKTTYRSDLCRGNDILKVSLCATEDVFGISAHSALWATGGTDDFDPEPHIIRHAWYDTSNSQSYLVNGIHTTLDTFEAAYGKCPSTGQSGSIIIPCAQYTRELASNWSLASPSFGQLTTLWLEATKSAKKKDLGTAYVVVITIICILLVGIIVFFIVQYRKRRLEFSISLREPHDLGSPNLVIDVLTPRGNMTMLQSTKSPFSELDTTSRTFMDSGKSDIPSSIHSNGMCTSFFTHPILQSRQISMENIAFVQLISRGAYGEIWQCQYQNQYIAVKRLLQNKTHTLQEAQEFIAEIQLTASLHHPNIVTFIGVAYTTLEKLCMVLEFCARGDVQTYLQAHESPNWTSHKREMALGVAKALEYLHSFSPPILHRDIKAKNVLLSDQMHVKVIDFGISKHMHNAMTAGIGTPYWTAPENLQGSEYSESSDMYSFGVFLSEVDTCRTPYVDLKSDMELGPVQILHRVMNGTLQPSFSCHIPSQLEKIAKLCLHRDAKLRPAAKSVVEMLTG
uniref:Protein kinase putative n=1 Tax=Albugo laibachii Nc14 TaxID=890382 RepID=F0WDT1_9STRA|nr:protein kinase putative [Albugo laibachii Nc14]|eukprot:CCA19358.1 protein kinase putative [Albugo laibachii Nc14]